MASAASISCMRSITTRIKIDGVDGMFKRFVVSQLDHESRKISMALVGCTFEKMIFFISKKLWLLFSFKHY